MRAALLPLLFAAVSCSASTKDSGGEDRGDSSTKSSARSERVASAVPVARSPERIKATANIKAALDMEGMDEAMRGRISAQGLSEVKDYPLSGPQRKALEFAAGRDVDPSQCETVLAAMVDETARDVVEKRCGNKAELMKALISGGPVETRLKLARTSCKSDLSDAEAKLATPVAVVAAAVLRQQFDDDQASDADEKAIVKHVAVVCSPDSRN
jgi:hypothetical protein